MNKEESKKCYEDRIKYIHDKVASGLLKSVLYYDSDILRSILKEMLDEDAIEFQSSFEFSWNFDGNNPFREQKDRIQIELNHHNHLKSAVYHINGGYPTEVEDKLVLCVCSPILSRFVQDQIKEQFNINAAKAMNISNNKNTK